MDQLPSSPLPLKTHWVSSSFGFTCDFNFQLANEVENITNDDDGTFVDSELVNSINNKNDIDNINSLNIVNYYCVNNFYDSFQIDACNNSTDHKPRGIIETYRKMNGYKSNANGESLYLFHSVHQSQSSFRYRD